jgi:hypothetical protein
LNTQAGLDHPDEHHTDDQDAPVQDMVTTMANIKTSSSIDAVYQGDPIMSFRQCLKRYNYHSSLQMDMASRRWHKFTLSDFPMYRGYAPGAIHTTAAGAPYNYVKNTLMNYITPAFVCRRGSIRWRYSRIRSTTTHASAMMVVQRLPFSSSGYNYAQTQILPGDASASARARETIVQIPATWPGFAYTDSTVSPVISVDLPFLQAVRFLAARTANVTAPTNNVTHNMFHQLTTSETTQTATAIIVPRVDAFVAAGDDFALGMFIGAPRIYRIGIGSDPTPA